MSVEFKLKKIINCRACEKEFPDGEEALHVRNNDNYYCLRDECSCNREELGPGNRLTIVKGVIKYLD